MYKHILETVGNINWMAVGPLLVFFVFFVLVIVYAFNRNKDHIDKMAGMPFNDE